MSKPEFDFDIMKYNCSKHGTVPGNKDIDGKPYCPICYDEHPQPQVLEERESSTYQRLLNIEHNLNTLLDKVGPECPGRVECPTCGTVKNLGAVVLTASQWSTFCPKCNETLVILVQVIEQPKET